MCRFLAYLGPPATLEDLLFAPPHSLVHQSYAPRHQRHGTVNADGFGVGWYDRARRLEPARYRSDRPIWSDRSLVSMAGLIWSTAVVAAVRSATPPAPVEESGSPPFTWGPWLFAHNGAVEGFAGAVGVGLRGMVTARRAAQAEGSTDSAVVFALVLDALDQGADPPAALASALAAVEGVAPARLNLLLCDGDSVAATTCGDSLFVLDETAADGEGPGRVVIASEPWDDDDRWRAVPDRSVVVATREVVTVEPLPPAPPRAPR